MAWTAFRLALRLFWRRMPLFLVANVLWILTSLPLVTLPAATGGLFYLIHRVVLEERELDPDHAQFRDFWAGFRLYWQRSTLLVFVDLVALVLLTVAFVFYWNSTVEPLRWLVGPTVVMALLWAGMQLYLFPVMMAYPGLTVRQLARRAFILVLSHPGYTLLLLVWSLLLIGLSIALAGPVLLLLFSLLAMIQTIALRIIRVNSGELESTARPDKPLRR